MIAATLVQPTLSDNAAKQVAALTDHCSAVIAGMALNMIAVVLLIAGTVWLAFALAQRAPRMAMAGGVLGALVVLFEDSVATAGPSIVKGLDRAQATAVIDRIQRCPRRCAGAAVGPRHHRHHPARDQRRPSGPPGLS